jgi:hypothetical protein
MEALMPSLYEFAGVRCDRIVATVFARLGLVTGGKTDDQSG